MSAKKASRKKPVDAGPPQDDMLREVREALEIHEHQRALDRLTETLHSDPQNAALLAGRGAAHALRAREWPVWKSEGADQRRDSLMCALEDLNRAITLEPQYAEAHLNRGLVHLELLDFKSAVADLTRALELGMEPTFTLQAHARRSHALGGLSNAEAARADLDIVNVLRRKRGVGDDWRTAEPQIASVRATVAPFAKSTKREPTAPTEVASNSRLGADDPVDWAAIGKEADTVYRRAVKRASRGEAGPSPDEERMLVWLRGFPEPLREPVRVLLEGHREGAATRWEVATKLAGDELALAKAVVGREYPPLVQTLHYLLPAAAVLRAEPSWLSKVAEDFLREIEALGNYRIGQEATVKELSEACPTTVLSLKAVEQIQKLAGNKKYQPIAALLRTWGGLEGKAAPPAQSDAKAAKVVAMFESLTEEVLRASDAAALKKLHRKIDELDLLEAGDEPLQRKKIDNCVNRLRAHQKNLRGAAARELENILDTVTDS